MAYRWAPFAHYKVKDILGMVEVCIGQLRNHNLMSQLRMRDIAAVQVRPLLAEGILSTHDESGKFLIMISSDIFNRMNTPFPSFVFLHELGHTFHCFPDKPPIGLRIPINKRKRWPRQYADTGEEFADQFARRWCEVFENEIKIVDQLLNRCRDLKHKVLDIRPEWK